MIDLEPFKSKGLDTDCVLVDVQNIFDYIHTLDTLDIYDLPTVVPPWRHSLLGWNSPRLGGEIGAICTCLKSQVADGWWMIFELYSKEALSWISRAPDPSPIIGYTVHYVPRSGKITKFPPGEERDRIVGELEAFDQIFNGLTNLRGGAWNDLSEPITQYTPTLEAPIGPLKDGSSYIAAHIVNKWLHEWATNKVRSEEASTAMQNLVICHGDITQQVCLYAFCFAHAKNVVQRKQSLGRAARRRLDRGEQGVTQREYYYLDVRPIKRILETEGQIASTGAKQALHICRGHFKDFSGGKGLFGQHKGLYWWDMQVRGDVRRGVVEKGYDIRTK